MAEEDGGEEAAPGAGAAAAGLAVLDGAVAGDIAVAGAAGEGLGAGAVAEAGPVGFVGAAVEVEGTAGLAAGAVAVPDVFKSILGMRWRTDGL